MNRANGLLIDPNMYKTIVVDIDDVIANTCDVLHKCLTMETGVNIPVHTWSDHRLKVSYPMLEDDDISAIIANHDVFSNVDVLPGAIEALTSLRNYGYVLHLCTARASVDNYEYTTEQWLKVNKIPYDSISYVQFGKPKSDSYGGFGDCLKGNKCGYLFDDAIHNITDAIETGLVIKPVIVTKPWNVNHTGVMRTSGLFDFCKTHGLL
jgi:5'(3')-deoxyribonucleotidase